MRFLGMVEAYAGRTGAYYSLCSGWILGQGRPKVQTVRNGEFLKKTIPCGINRDWAAVQLAHR